MPVSYKLEVEVSHEWSSNSRRFATAAEAEAAGTELLSRWMAPTDSRVAETNDPVNARFNFDTFCPEMLPPTPPIPYVPDATEAELLAIERDAA